MGNTPPAFIWFSVTLLDNDKCLGFWKRPAKGWIIVVVLSDLKTNAWYRVLLQGQCSRRINLN